MLISEPKQYFVHEEEQGSGISLPKMRGIESPSIVFVVCHLWLG